MASSASAQDAPAQAGWLESLRKRDLTQLAPRPGRAGGLPGGLADELARDLRDPAQCQPECGALARLLHSDGRRRRPGPWVTDESSTEQVCNSTREHRGSEGARLAATAAETAHKFAACTSHSRPRRKLASGTGK